MKLFKIETIGKYRYNDEKTFIIMATNETNALIRLRDVNGYSQFNDETKTIRELGGMGLRIS